MSKQQGQWNTFTFRCLFIKSLELSLDKINNYTNGFTCYVLIALVFFNFILFVKSKSDDLKTDIASSISVIFHVNAHV